MTDREVVRDFYVEQPEEIAWRENLTAQAKNTKDEEDLFEW